LDGGLGGEDRLVRRGLLRVLRLSARVAGPRQPVPPPARRLPPRVRVPAGRRRVGMRGRLVRLHNRVSALRTGAFRAIPDWTGPAAVRCWNEADDRSGVRRSRASAGSAFESDRDSSGALTGALAGAVTCIAAGAFQVTRPRTRLRLREQ